MASSSDRYDLLIAQADALMESITHPLANLANISALLYSSLPQTNWCGFYLMHKGDLLLGPFCGLPACIRIPLGRGVCGTAAVQNTVQCVPDVHLFPGHIACDSASASELVIPLHYEGHVIGVLDIDSPRTGRFGEAEVSALTTLAEHIEKACDFSQACYSL